MFAETLSRIFPFYSQSESDRIFNYVTGNAFKRDITLIALYRALLYKRIKDEQHILINHEADYELVNIINGDGVTKGKIESYFEDMMSYEFTEDTRNKIIIQNVMTSLQDKWNTFKKIFNEECQDKDGRINFETCKFFNFKRLKRVEEYLEQRTNIHSIIICDEETNNTMIFVKELTIKSYHMICSFPHLYMPGFFKEKPVTDDEKNILFALTKTDSTSFVNLIQEYSKKLDLKDRMIDQFLSGLTKNTYEIAIRNLEQELQRTEDVISGLLKRYEESIKERELTTIKLEGYRFKQNSCEDRDEELAEYFKSHSNLDLISVEYTRINFIIKTYLNNFDPDMYETFKKRGVFDSLAVKNAWIKDKENLYALLDGLFCNAPKMRIKMQGYYSVDVNGYCTSMRGYNYPDNSYMANPHLQFHNCLGGNSVTIQDALCKGDLICAIETCMASAASVNFAESTLTFLPFLEELLSSNNAVINCNDGIDRTVEQATEWIKNQEKQNNTMQITEEEESINF